MIWKKYFELLGIGLMSVNNTQISQPGKNDFDPVISFGIEIA